MRIIFTVLSIVSISFSVYSLTFTVDPGEVRTTTLPLPDPGDHAVVSEGGSITTIVTAITMGSDDQTAVNNGVISTSVGVNAFGIDNNGGDRVVMLNNGLITTTGSGGHAMRSTNGADVVIRNNGNIATTNAAASGINQDGSDRARLINSGYITTLGSIAHGIDNNGDDVVILNTGHISTAFDFTSGIHNFTGNRGMITNSGRIITSGIFADGINHRGDDTQIINSGLIFVTGNGANGIQVPSGVGSLADNLHIINSGTIISTESFAIAQDVGLNPTYTLLRGSNLQGGVLIANSNQLNLNVETGLNLALTLDPLSTTPFGNFGIEAPFIHVGDTVGVIDPTGLALQSDVIADLSDTILNGIYRHSLGCCTPCGCGVWAQGIGSYRARSHAHDHVGYDNWQAGFLVGYDRNVSKGFFGLFAGATYGEAVVDQHTQKAFINSYVAGLTYETCFCDNFIGLAITAGYIDWDNDRFVMNNLASGGVETAHADINGLFLSPELTIARQFSCLCLEPITTFTLRYAGFFPGDYHENGSLTDLSVDNRYINLLTTRLEAALPFANTCGRCCWSFEPYVGVSGRYQIGNYGVDGELLGQSLNFNQGGPRNVAAFLTGFRGIQSFGCLNLFLNLEASFDSHSSARILGEGGVSLSF